MSTLFANGRIHRGAGDVAPASAILVRDARVAWIGDEADAPPAGHVVDLGGRTVLPGLSDPHVHLYMLALARFQVSLAGPDIDSIAGVVAHLASRAEGERLGGWLQACDLAEARLTENALPTRSDLDGAFPDLPVLLRRYCGHTVIVNSAAMRRLGLTSDTPCPAGGTFRRGPDGLPSGIAEDAAAEWILAQAPVPTESDLIAEILSIMRRCAAWGITSMVEAAVGFSVGYEREAALWERLRVAHDVPVRMGFMLALDPANARRRGLCPRPDPRWAIDTLKFFADGIIGGRTGALSTPYEDTGGCGVMMHPPGVLEESFQRAHAAGWRIAVHATGDAGIARAVDAIIEAAEGDCRRRHRIEHCFVPPDGLFPRLARHGITVVTQPGFLWRMGGSIRAGLGDRAEKAYPAASVLAAKADLAFSSDAPIGPLSPWHGIHAAIRRTGDGGPPIGAREALTTRDALDAYIRGGAWVMCHEDFRGTLTPGMAADLTVLNRDPFGATPDELADTRSLLTLVDGEAIYRDGAFEKIPERSNSLDTCCR